MSTGSPKRTRSDIVAALALPPGQFARTLGHLRRGDVLSRIGICLLAAAVMWLAAAAWAPPFAFRTGYIPPRDITARIAFQQDRPEETRLRQQEARTKVICIYQHDATRVDQLLQALKNEVIQIVGAESYARFDADAWREFLSGSGERPPQASEQPEAAFNRFRESLTGDEKLAQFEKALEQAFSEVRQYGLLKELEHQLDEGSQSELIVHPLGDELSGRRVDVEQVLIGTASPQLQQRLQKELRSSLGSEAAAAEVATRVFSWIEPKLQPTLSWNRDATRKAADEAAAAVKPETATYPEGTVLAEAGQPLSPQAMQLLREEHKALLDGMRVSEAIGHGISAFGMFVALYVLCGSYIVYHSPRVVSDLRRFWRLLLLVVATVVLCLAASRDSWRAEVTPLVLFGMIAALAYGREPALMLSAAVSLIVTLSLGQGLAAFVILVASVSASILLMGRIRSRTKLIYVGFWAAVVGMLTTLGVGTLLGQTFGASSLGRLLTSEPQSFLQSSFALRLLVGALWIGFCSLIAGFVMTGLLPFVERFWDVHTDISLLELGDAAHPLLQELARRAPGTYNHSINVASIAEAAAEAIGANGLLVRVGAYFHDIGKMLKPGYFTENQSEDVVSRHQSLLPAMSTLVIIAHVKDGADLARQHHLPQPIIDFIEQHHGTTLVEYFFHQATKRSEDDPDGGRVDETSFRYPGPKPQTREGAVMMLADAVESASRTLVDPGPARIESLVREISMKRLLDDQFDECGLTLQELHVIEGSLVKSLTAVYHARIKYPDQHTA